MKTLRAVQIALLATATSTVASLAPQPAQAIASFTGSGQGFNIPDDDTAGESSDIIVTENFLISDITVSLNSLTHSWLGDLIATLTHLETSTTVDLFRRVRFPIVSNGDSTSLNGTYNFNDAFTGDLWAVAESLGRDDDIAGGDYFPTGAGSAAKVPMLTTMSGLASNGTWRLTISDNSELDTGSLGSWALNLQGSAPTPVPGPLPLLGAGAAFGWSRRLRKRSRAAL